MREEEEECDRYNAIFIFILKKINSKKNTVKNNYNMYHITHQPVRTTRFAKLVLTCETKDGLKH